MVTAATASVWRLLSWRRSIFMRPTPKQYTLLSRSSSLPGFHAVQDQTAGSPDTMCISILTRGFISALQGTPVMTVIAEEPSETRSHFLQKTL